MKRNSINKFIGSLPLREGIGVGFLWLLGGASLHAQETYEIATIETPELNGTARYVGMGGALEALGADLSTISTNPAGVGLFRRSQASISMGCNSQSDATRTMGVGTTRYSFDQVGFVYSSDTSDGKPSFFNFAFNFSKSRNFSQILNAANYSLMGGSQNKQTFGKIRSGIVGSTDDLTYNQVDYLYYNNNGKTGSGLLNALGDTCYDASEYAIDRGQSGYIGNYEFNISGNIQNQYFLGLSIGIKDVHYKSSSLYQELLVDEKGETLGIGLEDWRKITGTGIDVKFGAIIRPIANSPFRFGLSISTPTFYSLRSTNETILDAGDVGSLSMQETYRYKFNTPWKFGASLGHTIGQTVALGASWEFADYGATSPRIDEGTYYDSWGYSYSRTSQDEAMKRNVQNVLKGVHTLKFGAEIKPLPELAVRLGYNYVSPMYQENGYKDGSVCSNGNYYTSQTDFVNWKATNRYTCGLGFVMDKVYLDVAYQYSTQKGDYYPFTNGSFAWTDNSGKKVGFDNIPTITEINNKRHQLLFTLGVKF